MTDTLTMEITNIRRIEGGSGTSDHRQLTNRDSADQHPMSAITGLPAALAEKADESDVTAEIARVEAEIPSVDNLATKAELQAVEEEIPSLSGYATETFVNNAVGAEQTARENDVSDLQGQIDALVSKSDVVDVVGTYAELQAYDTSSLAVNDVVKVLTDSTHENARTYYRWSGTAWTYIGAESVGYTKAETDTLLNGKQNTISDLAAIRSGAAAGATAVQPAALSSYATKAELEAVEDEIPDITGLASESYVDNSVSGKQDIPAEVTSGTSITLADNTEYRLTNVTTLTLAYPSGNFECWLRLTTASSGTITITLPTSQYIGDVPTFANGETWELSIKDGYVVAHKVGA